MAGKAANVAQHARGAAFSTQPRCKQISQPNHVDASRGCLPHCKPPIYPSLASIIFSVIFPTLISFRYKCKFELVF